MEHLVLTLWAASHVWALLSSSQPLLLAVFGLLLITMSAAARFVGGPRVQQSNRGNVARTPSLPTISRPRVSDAVPASIRHLTENTAAREHASAEGMYHRL